MAAALVPWSWMAFLAATGGAPSAGMPPIHLELRSGSCANARSALRYQAAIAATEPERERGLGFRTKALGKHEGMIFVYDTPAPRTFWMKDTHIPLAIFYFDAAGHLLSSAEMPVDPDPTNPAKLYPEGGGVTAVLEVERGVTRKVKAANLDTLCIPATATKDQTGSK